MKTILNKSIWAVALIAANAFAAEGPITTTFTEKELSVSKGENLFDLGKITQPKDINNIKAPSNKESFVEFKFITEDGLPVEFLIRRTVLPIERFAGLRAPSKDRAAFRERVRGHFAKANEAIITSFYTRHPATQEEWTEVYSVTDDHGAYRFAPRFDARVYPNGLLILDVRGKENILFGTGAKTAQQLLVGTDQIEIGGGKVASAAELYRVDI
jgi:hypothetical protein